MNIKFGKSVFLGLAVISGIAVSPQLHADSKQPQSSEVVINTRTLKNGRKHHNQKLYGRLEYYHDNYKEELLEGYSKLRKELQERGECKKVSDTNMVYTANQDIHLPLDRFRTEAVILKGSQIDSNPETKDVIMVRESCMDIERHCDNGESFVTTEVVGNGTFSEFKGNNGKAILSIAEDGEFIVSKGREPLRQANIKMTFDAQTNELLDISMKEKRMKTIDGDKYERHTNVSKKQETVRHKSINPKVKYFFNTQS